MSKKQDETRKTKEELSGQNKNSLPDNGTSKPAPKIRYRCMGDHQSVLAVYNVRGALVIPSEHLGLPVTEIDGDALSKCLMMTSITIPATVTSIGSGVFNGCDSLKSIKVAKDNPSYKSEKGVLLTKDGKTIIESARAAARAYIPKGVETIGEYAFSGNGNLKSVKIPEGVKEVGEGAFALCISITRLSLPDSLKRIGQNAFFDCRKLKSVSLPDRIAYVGEGAFCSCDALKKVSIPEDLGRHLEHAFDVDFKQIHRRVSKKIKYIKVNGNIIEYYKFDKKGGWCVSWPYIGAVKGALVIPKEIKGRPVTRISSYAFENCTKITSVEIPDGIQEINNKAFFYCSGLTSVRIPKSATFVDNKAFDGCWRLKSFIVDPDNPVYSSVSGLLLSKDGKTLHTIPPGLKSVNIPEGIEKLNSGACSNALVKSVIIPKSVKSIGDYAFSDCSKLRTVTIPGNVESIGDGAFYGCYRLAKVIISDGVKSIGEEAFKDCDSLKKVVLPDSVERIGKSAFVDCNQLKTVTVPKCPSNVGKASATAATNTANIIKEEIFSSYSSKLRKFIIPKSISVIGEEALRFADNLTKIIIPNGVTIIGRNAFSYCQKLKSVSIPKSVTSIGEYRSQDKKSLLVRPKFKGLYNDLASEKKGAFDRCGELESIKVARDNPAYRSVSGLLLTKDGKKLVEVPKGLTQIIIPDGVKVIGNSAFAGCEKLVSVTIPDSVTRLENFAFEDCSALTNITLPKSVTHIGKNAFLGCAELKFFEVLDGNPSFKSESGLLLSKDGADLLVAPKALTSVAVP